MRQLRVIRCNCFCVTTSGMIRSDKRPASAAIIVWGIADSYHIIQKFVEQQGWVLIEIYTDEDLHKKGNRHPALEQVMQDVRNGKFVVRSIKLTVFITSFLDC